MPAAILARLLQDIRACRVCRDTPRGAPIAHEPRPVLRVSATARIGIFGQAPGVRVHASGMPFTDPSGVRLRQWMAFSEAEFYDVSRVAILPMGFCFPGLDTKGGDLPPRPECAPLWRDRVMRELAGLRTVLLVGRYAHGWHLGTDTRQRLTDTVRNWRRLSAPREDGIRYWPLPHPSWRNNRWLKDNPWFEHELLPQMQHDVRRAFETV